MPLARFQVAADTPQNMTLLKLNLICIINCTTSKNKKAQLTQRERATAVHV